MYIIHQSVKLFHEIFLRWLKPSFRLMKVGFSSMKTFRKPSKHFFTFSVDLNNKQPKMQKWKWELIHWFNSWAKSKQSLELNKTWCSQLFAAVACRLAAVLYNVGPRLPGLGFSTSVHQKHQTCLSASWSKLDWELQFKYSGMFFFI